MPTTRGRTEPADPRAHVAGQLDDQARSCAAMGSPLYACLLRRAADDVRTSGPVWDVLASAVAPGRGAAVALRFLAAVHRLVLTGEAPELARHYPSAGGGGPPAEAWPAFHTAVAGHAQVLRELVALPCQTNEVGRCAGLVGGFLELAARFGLPLRLLEVGASAGLNLRWDHYRYSGGGAAWGPASSPVALDGCWRRPPPHTDAAVEVVERSGCDAAPVNPLSQEGRLALRASLWADQVERFARLDGALRTAEAVPAVVERASVERWLPGRLASLPAGATTVVYHSVVEEYLPAETRSAFTDALVTAGTRARQDAPLAWLRLEPLSTLRRHGVSLVTWPGGQERLLGTCGAHGTDVDWGPPS